MRSPVKSYIAENTIQCIAIAYATKLHRAKNYINLCSHAHQKCHNIIQVSVVIAFNCMNSSKLSG